MLGGRGCREANAPTRDRASATALRLTPRGASPPRLRGIDKCRLVRLPDSTKMPAQDGRPQHLDGYQRRQAVRLAQHVKERDLADCGRHTLVARGSDQRIPGAHRRSKRRDSAGIDTEQRAGEGDRRTPILELACGMKGPARRRCHRSRDGQTRVRRCPPAQSAPRTHRAGHDVCPTGREPSRQSALRSHRHRPDKATPRTRRHLSRTHSPAGPRATPQRSLQAKHHMQQTRPVRMHGASAAGADLQSYASPNVDVALNDRRS